MKTSHFIFNAIKGILLFSALSTANAGTPLWTFEALTATTIAVPSDATASVQYRVTNQSNKPHTLTMQPIPGESRK